MISRGVGAITERGVLLATASDGIIAGFNARPEKSATALAEKEGIVLALMASEPPSARWRPKTSQVAGRHNGY